MEKIKVFLLKVDILFFWTKPNLPPEGAVGTGGRVDKHLNGVINYMIES
jgi:hypothetical protein